MGSFSDFGEAHTLDAWFGAGAVAALGAPATWYLALYTTTPTDVGGGVEAAGAGYARLAITNNGANFPAATGTSPTQKANGAAFVFAPATGDWSGGADMVAWGLFDALAGNLVIWGPLSTPKPVLNGDTPSFPIGALTFTLD